MVHGVNLARGSYPPEQAPAWLLGVLAGAAAVPPLVALGGLLALGVTPPSPWSPVGAVWVAGELMIAVGSVLVAATWAARPREVPR